MKHVQQFHFTHCKNSAVVTSVLRNLPFNVLDINLAGIHSKSGKYWQKFHLEIFK